MRKFKIIIFLFSILFINNSTAQCWFNNLLLDANANPALSTYFKNASKEEFNAYKTLQTSGSNYVKTNPTYLEKFSKLNPETQVKIANFTDDKAGSTLTKFLDDCDDDFIAVLNNPDNAALVKGLTSYKDDVKLTIEELEKIGEQLDLDEASKLNTWLKRSKDIERFKNYTALGRKLGDKITLAIKDKTSNLFKKLKTELQIDNLEDYDILTEIPLITDGDGGFMKADIVLKKRSEDAFKTIEDVIIFENKLSQGTDFTIRQKEGFGAILNGKTSMKVKYAKQGLKSEELITVSKNKIYKISDHGKADDLNNLSIDLIEKVN